MGKGAESRDQTPSRFQGPSAWPLADEKSPVLLKLGTRPEINEEASATRHLLPFARTLVHTQAFHRNGDILAI